MKAVAKSIGEAYIGEAPAFAKPILAHLRELVHRTCPSATESIKWSHLFFEHEGPLCMTAAFKGHCSLGFWHQGMQAVLARGGVKAVDGAGSFGKIRSLADLPGDRALIGFLREAVALNESGAPARSRAKPRKGVLVHPSLARALRSNAAASRAFEAFTPGKRREYSDWIAEAKRDETRQKRIATALDWIAQGKSLNWRYVGC
jgi:hypothetical protein